MAFNMIAISYNVYEIIIKRDKELIGGVTGFLPGTKNQGFSIIALSKTDVICFCKGLVEYNRFFIWLIKSRVYYKLLLLLCY